MGKRKISIKKMIVTPSSEDRKMILSQHEGVKELYMSCDCRDPSHAFVLEFWSGLDKDGYTVDEMIVSIFLRPVHFFKRIWYALRYVFRPTKKDYPFDNAIFYADKAKAMRDFLNDYLLAKEIESESRHERT